MWFASLASVTLQLHRQIVADLVVLRSDAAFAELQFAVCQHWRHSIGFTDTDTFCHSYSVGIHFERDELCPLMSAPGWSNRTTTNKVSLAAAHFCIS